MRKLTQEEFIKRAQSLHGDKVSYEKLVYKNVRGLVLLTCKHHGDFSQTADSHLQGRGCAKCSGTLLSSTEQFVVRAKALRGHDYDYSNVNYVNNKSNVVIGCKVHGDFLQTPDNHLQGQSCPGCKESGFKSHKPASIYVLTDGNRTKVGITNRILNKRVKQINSDSGLNFEPLFEVRLYEGSVAKLVESKMLKFLRRRFLSDDLDYSGSTEVFLGVDRDLLLSELVKVCGEVFASQTK